MKIYNAVTITADIPRIMETTVAYARRPEEINSFCRDMAQSSQEMFVVLNLNTRNRIISRNMISLGIQNECLVHPREVFRAAIVANAAAIVCVHNHPSGDPSPSAEDIQLTRQLVQAGKVLRIKVLDSVIIGRLDEPGCREFCSLREAGIVNFED